MKIEILYNISVQAWVLYVDGIVVKQFMTYEDAEAYVMRMEV